MAILCVAKDYRDLGQRMANMVVGFTHRGEPVRAEQMQAVGAMQVLLRDAIHPNLVQSLEGTPAFVHGGPFANIAQGTNTAVATRLALKLADCVVTEAGFATDLGAEKFFYIKCRLAGLNPAGVVIVATAKAIAYHGGSAADGGLANLAKHIENVRLFGLEPVVALNRFTDDQPADLARIVRFCERQGGEAVVANHYAQGGAGRPTWPKPSCGSWPRAAAGSCAFSIRWTGRSRRRSKRWPAGSTGRRAWNLTAARGAISNCSTATAWPNSRSASPRPPCRSPTIPTAAGVRAGSGSQ